MELAFLLKKVISIFLMPLSIGILLISAGVYFLYRNKITSARRFILSGLVWLFVFSYAPVANYLLFQLEHRYPTLSQPTNEIRYIYVLGYGHQSDNTLPITSQVNKEAVVRLAEGIRLYYALNRQAKLIVSGYSGTSDPTPHALMQKKLAKALGVPEDDIITVPDAKDTEDEASAAEKIAMGASVAVVSSAYHLPRAIKFFESKKVAAIPAPTYHQGNTAHPDYLGIFSADALKKSTIVFHEYIGMLWQTLKGV